MSEKVVPALSLENFQKLVAIIESPAIQAIVSGGGGGGGGGGAPALLVESGAASKISALPAATVPLSGSELAVVVQGGTDCNTPSNTIGAVTRAAFYQRLSIYGSFGPDTIFSAGPAALLALIYTDIRNAATGNITLQLNWLDGQSSACFSEPIVIETSVFPGYTSISLALPIVSGSGDLQITATDGTGGTCQYDVTVVLLYVPFS